MNLWHPISRNNLNEQGGYRQQRHCGVLLGAKVEFTSKWKKWKYAVTIKHLEFSYEDKVLLKKANISFERGGKVAIIGPNGCGKSTLLKLIMGLQKPNSGEVVLGEHNVLPNYFEQNQVMLQALTCHPRPILYLHSTDCQNQYVNRKIRAICYWNYGKINSRKNIEKAQGKGKGKQVEKDADTEENDDISVENYFLLIQSEFKTILECRNSIQKTLEHALQKYPDDREL
ncbi:unnamed protein product [Lactuca virosa]|uniref:ABC transporter domain-containing protein n=1 Tax=Lactuca virosa TaxID=75947 RepID=A0AAU9PD63_9ASTR|nr:unnamed protein product [Lactuca virosa]